jgi:phosphatidylglycerophosphate synthase
VSQITWVHRAARVCVRPLVATAVTPNQLTSVRLATGCGAALAFCAGNYTWEVVGGCLFVLSAFLDRADGELARISGKTSPWGHQYDLLSDAVCNVAAFIAIGVGLSHGPLGAGALAMGVIAGGAIGAIFWLVQQMETAGEEFSGAGGFDPDDALFIVGPAAWFGALTPLLYAAALGAPLFLVFALWRYRALRVKSPG